MIQEIIVYIIFSIAVFVSLWKLYKTVKPKTIASGGCGSCSGCSCSSKIISKAVSKI